MNSAPPVSVTEVRVLEGPNLYFARPAVKVSVQVPAYLEADSDRMHRLADLLGMRRVRAGVAGSAQRQRFLMRLTARVVRRVAAEAGTSRLSVRTGTAGSLDALVVAWPWRRRGRAVALGEALEPVLTRLLDVLSTGEGEGVDAVLAGAAATVRAAEPGERATMIRPRIPVASVTGTNGKTTTTRLLAHIGMTAGLRTGWSSTDGVMVQGELVQAGDYSGPAGARTVLTAPDVQLGILETARGGLLLRGMGISHNDVSVVTNVTADHLGLHGIDTVDQLAEVKAVITRVTRKDGWTVLNGDDPRVRAMAAQATGRPWMFSLDPDSPALADALSVGGRAITVLDGDLVILRREADPDHLVRVLDVPMTLSGLSEHNIANALAATAAALGLGLPREAVVEGLRSFVPDLRHNPGRMNVYSVEPADGGRLTVVVDLAHNEAGLEALMNVCDGLRPPGSWVHLGLGAVGDRTNELLIGLGEIAGRRADRVQVAHKGHYLRGRTTEDLELQLVTGLANVGAVPAGSSPTELEALQTLVGNASDGDVVAIMCHAEREQISQWLHERGAHPDIARDIRRKVVASRGEHELEAEIAALWADEDEEHRIATARRLLEQDRQDARLVYELAGAHDSAGQERAAIPLYEQALAGGLREPHRHRAQIQQASSYRNIGELGRARQLLDELSASRPDSAAVSVFRALVAYDQGEPAAALTEVASQLMTHAVNPDDTVYREVLLRYVSELPLTSTDRH